VSAAGARVGPIAVVQTLHLGNVPGREGLTAHGCHGGVLGGHYIFGGVNGKGSEAVVHDGVEVVRLVTGVSVPAVPAGGVVRPCGLPALIAQIRERRGGVHPGVDEELPSAPGLDVVPVHVNVLVSVGPTLLVHEAEGVQKLVHDNLQVDAAVLLQSDLHSASPGSVGNLSIAASAPRHDVNVVVLVRPGHKPYAAVLLNMSEAGRNHGPFSSGEGRVYGVVENPIGPVIAHVGQSVLGNLVILLHRFLAYKLQLLHGLSLVSRVSPLGQSHHPHGGVVHQSDPQLPGVPHVDLVQWAARV